jgi:hypothetical protein
MNRVTSHIAAAVLRRTATIAMAAALIGSVAVGLPRASAGPRQVHAAAGKAVTRVFPLEGTADVLVYAKFASAKPISDEFDVPADAVVYARTTDGKRHRLGKLRKFYSVTAAGSSVAINNLQNGPVEDGLRWWDVATGKHGTSDIDHYVNASPTGWVYVGGGDDYVPHLMSETFDGKVSDLGPTLPAFDEVGLTTSAKGVVAYGASDDNDTDPAEAMYMSWSDPGNFHTLYNPPYQENYCPGLNSKVAVCMNDDSRLDLLPLTDHGTKVSKLLSCLSDPTAYGTSAIFLSFYGCNKGRLGAMRASGKIVRSTRRFAPHSLQTAFRRIIVANQSQTKILALKGVQKKPKVLVS